MGAVAQASRSCSTNHRMRIAPGAQAARTPSPDQGWIGMVPRSLAAWIAPPRRASGRLPRTSAATWCSLPPRREEKRIKKAERAGHCAVVFRRAVVMPKLREPSRRGRTLSRRQPATSPRCRRTSQAWFLRKRGCARARFRSAPQVPWLRAAHRRDRQADSRLSGTTHLRWLARSAPDRRSRSPSAAPPHSVLGGGGHGSSARNGVAAGSRETACD